MEQWNKNKVSLNKVMQLRYLYYVIDEKGLDRNKLIMGNIERLNEKSIDDLITDVLNCEGN